jgi:nitric oxide reductase large subunit
VFLIGFAVLGFLAYRTYTAGPPIPKKVLDPSGEVVFTGEEIRTGQKLFLQKGLMQYGSIFGHGAYLGPDYTADYLRRERYCPSPVLTARTGRAAALGPWRISKRTDMTRIRASWSSRRHRPELFMKLCLTMRNSFRERTEAPVFGPTR